RPTRRVGGLTPPQCHSMGTIRMPRTNHGSTEFRWNDRGCPLAARTRCIRHHVPEVQESSIHGVGRPRRRVERALRAPPDRASTHPEKIGMALAALTPTCELDRNTADSPTP